VQVKTGTRDITDKLYALVEMYNGTVADERLNDSSFMVVDPVTDDIYEVTVRLLDKELMGSALPVFGTTRLESVLDLVHLPDQEQVVRCEPTIEDDCSA
jgi:hypothetical protein